MYCEMFLWRIWVTYLVCKATTITNKNGKKNKQEQKLNGRIMYELWQCIYILRMEELEVMFVLWQSVVARKVCADKL
jgi:hypothetical protein